LRGQLARLFLQLLIGLLQLFLLGLQLFRHALRLAQKLVGLHGGLDSGHDDTQAFDQLFEEGDLHCVEALERSQFQDPLISPSKVIGTTTILSGDASPRDELMRT
jgi:hypothetical protein